MCLYAWNIWYTLSTHFSSGINCNRKWLCKKSDQSAKNCLCQALVVTVHVSNLGKYKREGAHTVRLESLVHFKRREGGCTAHPCSFSAFTLCPQASSLSPSVITIDQVSVPCPRTDALSIWKSVTGRNRNPPSWLIMVLLTLCRKECKRMTLSLFFFFYICTDVLHSTVAYGYFSMTTWVHKPSHTGAMTAGNPETAADIRGTSFYSFPGWKKNKKNKSPGQGSFPDRVALNYCLRGLWSCTSNQFKSFSAWIHTFCLNLVGEIQSPILIFGFP